MNQQVQSAFEAANRGENNKALGILKQVLAANPNDVDAWLVLAAVVEQPERKRQCLNRVLALDPTNEIARNELLDMDRAAMGGPPPSVPEPAADSLQAAPPTRTNDWTGDSAFDSAPVSRAAYSSTYPTSTSAFEPAEESLSGVPQPSAPVISQTQIKVAPGPTPRNRREEPRVLYYATIPQIMTYVAAAIFAVLSLISIAHPILLCIPCGLFLLTLPAIWIVSAQVEINGQGIRSSHLYGLIGSQVSWNEIARIRSASMQNSLELTTPKGKRVKISSQVNGYPVIVEMLREKRPDLFGMAASASQDSSMKRSSSGPAPAFSTKKFEKSFFKQFGSYLLTVPFCLYATWMVVEFPEYRIGAAVSICFCVVIIVIPLFQVNAVIVEPNKLTIETLFEKKVFSARQISEIKMQTMRGRYGRLTHFVNIIPLQGKKNYPLQGFSAGDEVIYGFLINWWNTYAGQ